MFHICIANGGAASATPPSGWILLLSVFFFGKDLHLLQIVDDLFSKLVCIDDQLSDLLQLAKNADNNGCGCGCGKCQAKQKLLTHVAFSFTNQNLS